MPRAQAALAGRKISEVDRSSGARQGEPSRRRGIEQCDRLLSAQTEDFDHARGFDDVLPGPNAQAALVLAELAMVTRDPAAGDSYRRRARKTLEAFAGAMLNPVEPIGTATFLAAAQKTLQRR